MEEDFWGRTDQEESYSRKKHTETINSTSNEEDVEMNAHTEMDNGAEDAIHDDQTETIETTDNNIYLDQLQIHQVENQMITNEETGEEEQEEDQEKEHFQFQSEDKIQLTEDNTNIDDVTSAGDDVFEWGDGDA